jgi:hypothetical protein
MQSMDNKDKTLKDFKEYLLIREGNFFWFLIIINFGMLIIILASLFICLYCYIEN